MLLERLGSTLRGRFLPAGLVWVAMPWIAAGTEVIAAESDGAVIEEIVVTATKRGRDIQTVPTAVTALTGEELERRGIDSAEELAMVIPNLNYGMHAGASFITIRGVGSTINSGVSETTVATYVDGLYLPRATMANLQQIDLERVEVLRGPQGTLYGRNATGGAVNFISKLPSEELTAGVTAGTGSRDQLVGNGFISGPITDDLGFRLSGGYERHDSYMKVIPDNDTVTVKSTYARAALRYEPADANLTADLSLKYQLDEGADTYQQAFSLPTRGVPPGTLVTTRPNRTAADFPFDLKHETLMGNVTLNWDVTDSVSLRTISGYIEHDATTDFEADTTAFPLNVADDFVRPSDSFSQEVVLLGETGRIEWLAGAYFYQEDFEATLPVVFPTGLPGALPPGTALELSLAEEETESWAVYGDMTLALTDRLRVNAGLRYNDEKKDFRWRLGVIIPGLGDVGAPADFSGISGNKLLPKAGVQFDLTDAVNLYVTYQKGFKSGGHDIALPRTFDDEELDAYEAGFKSEWFDRAVTLNAALFFYDYQGLQITNNTGPATTQVENADAELLGIEAELLWAASETLTINLSGTWTDSEYTDFASFDASRPQLGLIDLDGRQVIQAPELAIKGGAEWRIPLDGFLSELALRADVAYTDDIPLRYFATENDIQDAYTLINASVVFTSANRATELNVFATNLGDKKYKRMIDYLGAVDVFDGNYGAPRTIGARLTWRLNP